MDTGLYKISNGWATEDSAMVRYADGKELEIPKSQYEAQAYEPPFDALPLKDEFDKRHANRT